MTEYRNNTDRKEKNHSLRKPEILAPAGDIECLKAAFSAGADAVYFGLPSFNARQRAGNILPAMLPQIVSEARHRGIRLYLTVNTLVTEDETGSLLDLLDTAAGAGINAFIIQDFGVLYILKKAFPSAEIHISTQATTHTKGQIAFLAASGAGRVNLARELTIGEVKSLTEYAHTLGMETEVFVHGSYCLSYSGQCYLCSFLEGTSGNRGLCQQNCRRIYRRERESGYFLNLKDNCAIDFADTLSATGVDSLKIEGRIKSPLYVYSVVKGWKTLMDNPGDAAAKSYAMELFSGVFNRDFTASYLSGTPGKEMFAPSPKDRSLKQFAAVVSYTADTGQLVLDSPAKGVLPCEAVIKDKSGNFVCSVVIEKELSPAVSGKGFPAARESFLQPQMQAAGRIKGSNAPAGKFQMSGMEKASFTARGSSREPGSFGGRNSRGGESLQVYSGAEGSRPGRGNHYIYRTLITGKLGGKITKGCVVFASHPAVAAGEAEQAAESVSFRKLPVEARVRGEKGRPFALTLFCRGKEAVYLSEKPVEKSLSAPVSQKDFEKQLSRFGTTPFELENMVFEKWEDDIFVPASEVNAARRKCVADLLGTMDTSVKDLFLSRYYIRAAGAAADTATCATADTAADTQSVEGADAAGKSIKPYGKSAPLPPLLVYLDNPFTAGKLKKEFGEKISIMFEVTDESAVSGKTWDNSYIPVLPGIVEYGMEKRCEKFIKESPHKKFILNSTGFIKAANESGKSWTAGNFLNITNSISLSLLKETAGCSGAIPSLELSASQIRSMADKSPLPLYLFLYSPLKLMTTRQCLFSGRICGKKTTDKECYYNCSKQGAIDEIGGRSLKLVKRKFRFTELYDSSYMCVPEISEILSDKTGGFVIDLRDIFTAGKGRDKEREGENCSVLSDNSEIAAEITKAFLGYIEGPSEEKKKKIYDICGNVSKGNIKKGLT